MYLNRPLLIPKTWAHNNQNYEHIYLMVEPILELPIGFELKAT